MTTQADAVLAGKQLREIVQTQLRESLEGEAASELSAAVSDALSDLLPDIRAAVQAEMEAVQAAAVQAAVQAEESLAGAQEEPAPAPSPLSEEAPQQQAEDPPAAPADDNEDPPAAAAARASLRLTERECGLIRECLEVWATPGAVVEHDDDLYRRLLGVGVEEFLAVQRGWPAFQAMSNQPISRASWQILSRALHSLLHYPHALQGDEAWAQRMAAPKAEFRRVHDKVYAGMAKLAATRGGAEEGGGGTRLGETPKGLEGPGDEDVRVAAV